MAAGASLTLQSLTLQGGAAYEGGRSYSAGTVILNGVIVQNNIAATDGGGIYSTGSLTLEGGSIFQKNGEYSVEQAFPSYGGGIYAFDGTVTMTNATLNNNGSTYGGGMYAAQGRYGHHDRRHPGQEQFNVRWRAESGR